MGDFKKHFGRSIQESFEEYHKNNPKVYRLFKKLAFKAIKAGKKRISFKMILNVIRWEIFIGPVNPNLFDQPNEFSDMKINDAYSSRYARLFAADYPKHADKIELRELRS